MSIGKVSIDKVSGKQDGAASGPAGTVEPAGAVGDYRNTHGHLHRASQRLAGWVQTNTAANIALMVAAGVAFFTTWVLMSPVVENANRAMLIGLIVANVLIAAAFGLLVGAQLWRVWSERRNRLAGSRTHMQLVWAFSIAAVVPAIIAFLFAFTILRSSMDNVFSGRIDQYQNTARQIANLMVDNIASQMFRDMQQTENDIFNQEALGIGFETTPIGFREYLKTVQMPVRGAQALYILDRDRNLIMQLEASEADYRLPPQTLLDNIDRTYDRQTATANISASGFRFSMNKVDAIDMWMGVQKIRAFNGGYLVLYKSIDETTRQQMLDVRAMAADWRGATDTRRRMERVFVAGYVVLATIILFGAIWAALGAANRIVGPISRLVGMADRVSGGDLGARVAVYRDDGELGELARSMNRMTAQLQAQRNDLIDTNRQFDQRRRFTEAVLSGVSAGVLGIDKEGRVTIANRSAAELIGVDHHRIAGSYLGDLVPELHEAFEVARQSPAEETGTQIGFHRQGQTQTFNVRIVRDVGDSEHSFIMTLDDITQLITAQRNAAWGDVARRIAHEIKNPLTPIQLSAERLRRKYLREISSNPEVFDKCTDTIIRQVKDIGRMVDEFSSFARMPTPVINREDVRELLKSAVFPQRVAFPDIEFDVELPDVAVPVACDGRLIVQALSNLMKNAGESVTTRQAADEAEKRQPINGQIRVISRQVGGHCLIEIIDNGVGLPAKERHRLVEPYMTTREKGTGLGLAIVKKVVEEHGGQLSFNDDDRLGMKGARVSVRLPLAKPEENTREVQVSHEQSNAVEEAISLPAAE